MIDLLQAIQENRKSAREIFEGEQNKLLTLQHTRYLTECHDASRGNGWDVLLVLQQTHLGALGAPSMGHICAVQLSPRARHLPSPPPPVGTLVEGFQPLLVSLFGTLPAHLDGFAHCRFPGIWGPAGKPRGSGCHGDFESPPPKSLARSLAGSASSQPPAPGRSRRRLGRATGIAGLVLMRYQVRRLPRQNRRRRHPVPPNRRSLTAASSACTPSSSRPR